VPGGKHAVVHRDFKPENILLDDELNAYLADTGFAKMDAGPEASKMKSALPEATWIQAFPPAPPTQMWLMVGHWASRCL